jgi:hypothetical protein
VPAEKNNIFNMTYHSKTGPESALCVVLDQPFEKLKTSHLKTGIKKFLDNQMVRYSGVGIQGLVFRS